MTREPMPQLDLALSRAQDGITMRPLVRCPGCRQTMADPQLAHFCKHGRQCSWADPIYWREPKGPCPICRDQRKGESQHALDLG